MGNLVHDKEHARQALGFILMITWPFVFRLMLMSKDNWKEIRSYQELSSHPSLPFNVQESQHMMMIAVCLVREGRSRTAAEDLQACRPYILGVSLIILEIHFAHNLVVAHCRC